LVGEFRRSLAGFGEIQYSTLSDGRDVYDTGKVVSLHHRPKIDIVAQATSALG
jgi:hypothetical protein